MEKIWWTHGTGSDTDDFKAKCNTLAWVIYCDLQPLSKHSQRSCHRIECDNVSNIPAYNNLALYILKNVISGGDVNNEIHSCSAIVGGWSSLNECLAAKNLKSAFEHHVPSFRCSKGWNQWLAKYFVKTTRNPRCQLTTSVQDSWPTADGQNIKNCQ